MADQALIDDIAEMIIGTCNSRGGTGAITMQPDTDDGKAWTNPTPGSGGKVHYRWPSRNELVTAVGAGVASMQVIDRTTAQPRSVTDVRIGGVMVFPWMLELQEGGKFSNAKLVALLRDLREAARDAGRLPPLICVDQEGGGTGMAAFQTSERLSPKAMGAKDPAAIEAVARGLGEELAFAGFTVDLAPNSDVAIPGGYLDSESRSYGSDVAKVAPAVEAFSRGLRRGGVMPCAKHMPGHGSAVLKANSHKVLPLIHLDWAQLDAGDLEPFRRAAAGGAQLMLAAHLLYHEINDDELPASQSDVVLAKIASDGRIVTAGSLAILERPLVMTDDLDAMRAVNYEYGETDTNLSFWQEERRLKTTHEIVLNALIAGVDLFLCQYRWPEIFDELVKLADVYPNRALIHIAAERVRTLKAALDANWKPPTDLERQLKGIRGVGELDIRIDYGRPAALPFGLAPAPSWPQLARHVKAAAVGVDWLEITDPALDPGSVVDRRVRWVNLGDTSEKLYVPCTSAAILSGAGSDREVIVPAAYVSAGRTTGPMNDTAYRDAEANAVIWDRDAQSASNLPIPMFPAGTLCMQWGEAAPDTSSEPMLANELPAGYLLPTPTTGRTGELDPAWLRAPLSGKARFERYDHLIARGDGVVAGPRSQVGRVVILAATQEALPALRDLIVPGSPLLDELVVVVEHVRADSVVEAWSALLEYQVKSFAGIYDGQFKGLRDRSSHHRQLRSLLGWLLRCWRASKEIARTAAQVPAKVVDLGYDGTPTRDQLSAALAALDSAALVALLAFAKSAFLPAMMGQPWQELGIVMRAPGAGRAGLDPAYTALDAFRYASRWIVIYAGCPIGKAGAFYRAPSGGEATSVTGAFWSQLSTFDAEAQALAGAFAPSVSLDATELRRTGKLVGLAGTSLQPTFPMAGLRLVSPARDASYNTIAWLGELLAGRSRASFQVPLLNFRAYRQAGHPLATVWEDAAG